MKLWIFIFVFWILSFEVPAFSSGQAGLELPVLRAGVGARPLSMGGAFVSIADNADAGFWNPAGLSHITSQEITTMQTKLSADVDHYYISYASKFLKGTFGFSWIQVALGNITQTASTDAFNEVVTTNIFNYFSNAYMLSYGMPINPNVSVGLTAKYLTSDMGSVSKSQATGYSITPGILVHPKENISIGAKIDELFNEQNSGTGNVEKAPPKARVGISLDNIFLKNGKVAFDVSQVLKSSYAAEFALGYEVKRQNISLRAGLLDSGVTAGAGFSSGIASLDYAYVQQASLSRDNVHRISLSGKW